MNATNDELPPLTSPDRHILNAQHTWLEENGLIPQIIVADDHPALGVPKAAERLDHLTIYDPYAGQIATVQRKSVVLNISYRGTHGLQWGEHGLTFAARFKGKSHDCFVPYEAIMEIHGRGDVRTRYLFPRRAFIRNTDDTMTMHDNDVLFGNNTELPPQAPKTDTPVKPARDRSHLSVVK